MSDTIEKMKAKSVKLYDTIESEVGSSTMDLIKELIENEIEIESYCNQ